jgi:hypothetical protein
VRAAVVMRVPASRSALRSKEGKSEAERTTKPSFSRAARAAVYGSLNAVVMFDVGDRLVVVVVPVLVAMKEILARGPVV